MLLSLNDIVKVHYDPDSLLDTYRIEKDIF